MQIDYLIIGQGISGTWLSYYLQKEQKSFIIIDNNFSNSPSRIAAGIINPVTGRRHVEVWLADEIITFANSAYTALGKELSITTISQKNIIDFFPSPQMRVSFMQRVGEKAAYVSEYSEQEYFRNNFNYDFGCGEIKPVYTVHLDSVLPAWRNHLKEKNLLLKEEFEIEQLKIAADKIQYKNITASKIIFCDGANCADNPYFKLLPFAPNKGELLLVEIPDLPTTNIYKKGMMLTPLSTPGLWWIGSNYAWQFDNPNPTPAFKEKTEALLKEWLKVPFKIVDHLAGIRPATLERRPFVGLHPLYPNIGILNGMGTKGCSLAPYFAKQLAEQLIYNNPISAEADINRFTKILMKG
ncbi:MAG: FAD-binding oxidoreductase [Chitinophagaceae bacterium]|nr:FAD-binding oxidoreductase [Chitinophagaceae bacterium]